jgi:hypothetical protein
MQEHNYIQARTRAPQVALAAAVAGLLLALCIALMPAAVGGPAVAAAADKCALLDDDGTGSRDRLRGTNAADLIRAKGGRDKVSGSGGDDCLRGGGGADRIVAGPGSDVVRSGSGPDRIQARDGAPDLVICGGSRDRVIADDDDVLRGCEVRDPNPPDNSPAAPAKPCAFDPATMTTPGCEIVASDTAANPDADGIWGNVECATDDRVQLRTGGDQHPTASGELQPDDSFRELTVFDGDDFSGERCELGRNEYRAGEDGGDGTFALYEEGQHRITFASLRIGDSLPADGADWQTLMQMKQSQPALNGGGSPIIALELHGGNLVLQAGWESFWSVPAPRGQWVRVAMDTTYSAASDQGALQMYIDLNGDGDASDEGEQSPVYEGATLKSEVAPGSTSANALAAGESIPSHLRMGVYHNPAYACPSGCSVDVDNVQVVEAS